jgi:hypothetical protein
MGEERLRILSDSDGSEAGSRFVRRTGMTRRTHRNGSRGVSSRFNDIESGSDNSVQFIEDDDNEMFKFIRKDEEEEKKSIRESNRMASRHTNRLTLRDELNPFDEPNSDGKNGNRITLRDGLEKEGGEAELQYDSNKLNYRNTLKNDLFASQCESEDSDSSSDARPKTLLSSALQASRQKEQRRSLIEGQISSVMKRADSENKSNRDSGNLSSHMQFAVGQMITAIKMEFEEGVEDEFEFISKDKD